MKTKHWVPAGVGMVIALALLAGNAQAADDGTSYRFRLSNYITKATYIRCGSSGAWTTVAVRGSTIISCSQSTAQTKFHEGVEAGHTYNCPSNKPVLRVMYYERLIWGIYATKLDVRCKAS